MLPATSTPDSFPPAFPIDLLPNALRTPETFTESLYELLLALDPESAARWHWRDIRKVRRALEIVWEGRTWADVRRAQEENASSGETGARFRTLVFWLFAEKPVLDERLDKRVDKMLDVGRDRRFRSGSCADLASLASQLGLLDEIQSLWSLANAAGPGALTDYSKGIYQTIGYKEFEPFLSARASSAASGANPDAAPLDSADPLFANGLELMKVATRQYAKRQVKWITGKLLPEVRKQEEGNVTVVLLDATGEPFLP